MLRTDHAGFCEFCLWWMWIHTKQFIKPVQASRQGRMKKWNSSEKSIHVLMSTLNDSVFKNCLPITYKKIWCPPCTMMKALQPKKVSIVKWSAQIVVLFHPFKSWQFQTSIQFYFSSFSPPAIFCWITFSHLVEFISKWN